MDRVGFLNTAKTQRQNFYFNTTYHAQNITRATISQTIHARTMSLESWRAPPTRTMEKTSVNRDRTRAGPMSSQDGVYVPKL